MVFTLLVDANPIPDPVDADPMGLGGREYLASLESRSREVTRLDTKPAPKRRRRSSMAWSAAAAAIVVVGTVALVVLIQSGDETPSATVPVSTIVPATIESFEGVWDAGDVEVQFAGSVYAISEGASRSDIGQWTLRNGQISLSALVESEDCDGGTRGVYEYEFADSGTLNLTRVSDDCELRRGFSEDTTTLTRGGHFETGDPEWDAVTVFVSPQGPSGLPPGDYRSGRFDVPFRFTLPEGWTSFFPERSDALTLATRDGDTSVEFHLFRGRSPLGTLGLFNRGKLNVSAAAEIPGGYAVFLSPSEPTTLFSDPLDGDYIVQPGTQVWLRVVDVHGTVVTIIQQAQDSDGLFETRPIIFGLVWQDN
jgi:hypothetical protein